MSKPNETGIHIYKGIQVMVIERGFDGLEFHDPFDSWKPRMKKISETKDEDWDTIYSDPKKIK
jgi:hypothetical protein